MIKEFAVISRKNKKKITKFASGGGEGAEVIYALRNPDTLAKNVLENIGQTGQTTRKYYQRRLPSDTSKDYYFIHRNTGSTEPIIVEYGFIDNAKDVNFLDNNYKALAEAVIKAVANYSGVPYTSPEGVTTNTYIVQRGDTLYSIARKLGTTVDELIKKNNLSNTNLTIGQVLQIPTPEPPIETEDIYIVQKGDSLYSIARDYNTTVDELRRLNNLTSDLLTIGQRLLLPNSSNTSSPQSEEGTYIVQRGDSLYSIAQKLGTTVDKLKKENNLTSNLLSVGQVLRIPTQQTNNITYTVQKGDSLYSIARDYNTTVDAIKNLNNLTSNLLSIGQILQIPVASDTQETTYTVQKGDSLYSIAKKFGTTVDTLKKLNNLSSNLLSIGQILIIKP